MGVTVGLLALSLMGADGAPGPDQSQIRYQLRMLEMDGLDWRKGVYTQLQPVSRRGGIAVWTAGRDVVKPLAEGASDVLMAPQVTAVAAAPVFFNHHKNISFVGQLTRIADGPKDRATALAYKPEVDGVREGFAATITGRKLDQGVLTRLVLEETRCSAMHGVMLSEAVKKGDKGDEIKLGATLQVPETARVEVAGEWLIPTDGVLVISLGAHTVADAEGKAVVREHLAIVEPRPLGDGDVVRARFSGAPCRSPRRRRGRRPGPRCRCRCRPRRAGRCRRAWPPTARRSRSPRCPTTTSRRRRCPARRSLRQPAGAAEARGQGRPRLRQGVLRQGRPGQGVPRRGVRRQGFRRAIRARAGRPRGEGRGPQEARHAVLAAVHAPHPAQRGRDDRAPRVGQAADRALTMRACVGATAGCRIVAIRHPAVSPPSFRRRRWP